MRNERELVHNWVGRPGLSEEFMLRCRERRQVAFMDIDIANELPYCPFCRRNIEYRPGNIEPAPSTPGPGPAPGAPPEKPPEASQGE